MAAPARQNEPTAVGKILSAWLNQEENEEVQLQIIQERIRLCWSQIVGERMAARTAPKQLRDGVLTIEVSGSAWLNELNFLKDQIAQKINEFSKRRLVERLQLVAGQRKQRGRR